MKYGAVCLSLVLVCLLMSADAAAQQARKPQSREELVKQLLGKSVPEAVKLVGEPDELIDQGAGRFYLKYKQRSYKSDPKEPDDVMGLMLWEVREKEKKVWTIQFASKKAGSQTFSLKSMQKQEKRRQQEKQEEEEAKRRFDKLKKK